MKKIKNKEKITQQKSKDQIQCTPEEEYVSLNAFKTTKMMKIIGIIHEITKSQIVFKIYPADGEQI